jgi:hypothetical protein
MTFGNAFSQAPNAPTNLVVSPINTGGMIQFTAPNNLGGSAITNYEYSTDDGASWTTPSPAITESPLIISSGLTNCTTYQVKIRAVNSSGSGVASVAENLTPRPSAAPGSVWTLETASENNSWIGITYGNGLFVAVSQSGTNRIMTSPDGITWTARTAPEANAWSSITYGNGLFVAVAYFGANRVMTSPDGINWTARTAPLSQWNSVTYGNGLYVAVSVDADVSTPKVMTSPDGINWTSRLAALNVPWYSVTFGNGLFVAVTSYAVSDPSKIMTSQDGINWISRYSPTSADTDYVSYGNGLFVAGGSNYFNITSSDGITWNEYYVGDIYAPITYGNGMFVALSNGSSQKNKIKTSSNGSLWNINDYIDSNGWQAITYGNGIFVGVASTGSKRVLRSTYAIAPEIPTISSIAPRNNGVRISIAPSSSVSYYAYSIDNGFNWINSYPSINSNEVILDINALTNNVSYPLQLKAINAGGASCPTSVIDITPSSGTIPDAPTNLTVNSFDTGSSIEFKAPNNDGGSYITNYEYSLDNGTTWITPSPTIKESPITISGTLSNCSSYQMKLRGVNEYGSGTASETSVLSPKTSTNPGNTWTKRTASENNTWSGVAYGNGVYVAVAVSGTNRVMSSNDGINWTARMAAEANGWRSVCYGNGLFVAVAVDGMTRVMTSPDGINWTPRQAAQSNTWNDIKYGNGLFVAVASSGVNRVMTSPDGINWTARTTSQANNWNSVTYGNGVFVAVASSGTYRVMTSTNGVTWTARTASQANSWNSVTYGNGLFVAVSVSGTNRVMTSPNGTTWTNRTASENNNWNSITYGNGLFVAVASTGTNRMMTSTNGTNWTAKSIDANSWSSVIYGNVSFVAVAGTGTNSVITSTYSLSPEAPIITSTSSSNAIATVSFTQSALLNDATISNYEYSTDNGTSWTALSPAATTSPLSISGLPEATSSMMLRAVNSVGVSCPSNNFSLCTPTYSTETISICSSYTWAENGQTYTTSGTYTSTIGCDSKTLELTIATPSAAGMISGATFVAMGTNSTTLTVSNNIGSIQWQMANSISGPYSDIIGATTASYLATNLTSTSYYRVQVTNGSCNSATSLPATITVGVSGDTTTLIDSLCGNTIESMSTTISCYPVNGATLYKFKITTLSTNASRYYSTTTNNFSLSKLLGLNYNTAYSISISAKIGYSFKSFGAECIITTPYAITKIRDSQCGNTLTNINSTIYTAKTFRGTTGYRFEVTNGNNTYTYESLNSYFRLSQLNSAVLYNSTYAIRVSVNLNGIWHPFGETCLVSTPPVPLTQLKTTQCGITLSTNNDNVLYANPVVVAQLYRFEISNASNVYYYETTSSMARTFRLTQVQGLTIQNGATYSIRVAIMANGVWQPYGPSCSVTASGIPSEIVKTIPEINNSSNFNVFAYPNPFTENFKIDLKSSNEDKVIILVYDMLGKLIEAKSINTIDYISEDLGSAYPAGVYNVIVTQGENVKTLRVIKR